MKRWSKLACLGIRVTLVASLAGCGAPREQGAPDLEALAEEAYVYGYPLVLMGVTERVMTSYAAPSPDGYGAPVNQLAHMRAFPTPDLGLVVRPNVDTLYSTAWLDLSRGPVVLHVPDTAGRYYVMPILDAWTNVFVSLGARTTGTQAGDFVIVGPGFHGALPAGATPVHAPTSTAWILGRVQTNGPADYAAVHALQDGFSLTELRPAPPASVAVDPRLDVKTPPMLQVAAMDAATFFGALAERMKANPPPLRDAEALGRFARLGLVPGASLALGALEPAQRAALNAAVPRALDRIATTAAQLGVVEDGWRVTLQGIGAYGTDYGARAAVALVGLGANLPEDAIYPITLVDSEGRPLQGTSSYRLHFDPGEAPPVNAFWSITLYDQLGFLVPNALGRYALGDRDALTRGPDGSLDLLIQHPSPGSDRESNWLPAPAGPFNLTLRMYWPRPEAASGAWRPPPVVRAGAP